MNGIKNGTKHRWLQSMNSVDGTKHERIATKGSGGSVPTCGGQKTDDTPSSLVQTSQWNRSNRICALADDSKGARTSSTGFASGDKSLYSSFMMKHA